MKNEDLLECCFLLFLLLIKCNTFPHGMVEITGIDPKNPIIRISEETATLAIDIIRVGGCENEAKITFQCFDRTATKDDYSCQERDIIFPDGDCSKKQANIFITNDDIFELEESFLFRLKSLNSVSLGFDRVLIIIEKSDVPHGVLSIFPANNTIIEGTNLNIQIYRKDGDYGFISCCYDIQSGTAKLIADVEYISGCLEWDHKDTTIHKVTIKTVSNKIWEGDEWFIFRLFRFNNTDNILDEEISNITIEQNYFSSIPIQQSTEPCNAEIKEYIEFNPSNIDFFVQWNVELPQSSKINSAKFIIEHRSENNITNIDGIVIEIIPIIIDIDYSVSCLNKPVSYIAIPNPVNSSNNNCTDDPNDITLSVGVNAEIVKLNGSRPIYCSEWLITGFEIGKKFISQHDYKYGLDRFIEQGVWSKDAMATFMFRIKDYVLSENETQPNNLQWIIHLVIDAYPCTETDWSEWSECSAKPVGRGYQYKWRISVHGIPGNEYSCGNITHRQDCVVSLSKTVWFSTNNIRIKESDNGHIMNIRLMGELNNTELTNVNQLTQKQLDYLRGYDVVVQFEIPEGYKHELIIEPIFVGWYTTDWDTVKEIRFSAIDDAIIDEMEMRIRIETLIYSRDSVYNMLNLDEIVVIIEDNESCQFCNLPNVATFEPPKNPSIFNTQVIIVIIIIVLFIGYIIYRAVNKNKKKEETVDEFFVDERRISKEITSKEHDYAILSLKTETNTVSTDKSIVVPSDAEISTFSGDW